MGDIQRQSLFEAVPEPVVLVEFVDEEPVVRDANGSFERCFGYGVEELRGESINDYLLPDEEAARETAREIDAAAANGEHVQREVERAAADGRRHFLFCASPFEQAETVKSIGIYVDVTEYNRERRRFKTLIQHTSDVVTILEPDGTIRYESPSVEQVLGYDQQALVGENAFEYVHPEDRKAVVSEFSRAISDPESHPTIEYRFRTADGSWCTLESIGSNYVDNESIHGYVVSSRDVTERKRRERELQRKNDRLDQFASIISHDLRNPLNVAQGRLDLIAEECDSAHVDVVAESLDRIEDLVEDTLRLAREGRTIEDPSPFELDEVVRQAWSSVSTPASELIVAFDAGTLFGDADRVRELLENVFRNAVEHGSGHDETAGQAGEGGSPRTRDWNRGHRRPNDRSDRPSRAIRGGVLRRGRRCRDSGVGLGYRVRTGVHDERCGHGTRPGNRPADCRGSRLERRRLRERHRGDAFRGLRRRIPRLRLNHQPPFSTNLLGLRRTGRRLDGGVAG
jgi:PAS domain S-box-containing protein